MNGKEVDITIKGLREHYANGDFAPRELIAHLLEKCRHYADKNIWISLLTAQQLEPYLARLETRDAELPLYGIPFAIKDNIDLAGIPTTAACREFSYSPQKNAFVVDVLIDAGAIPLGKTNMDQFATGLVGTRSPWGPCKNALHDDYIAGGSSSGSAVAVSLGLASFALGTDTAGSGRVPAALNNLVGLKPSRGVLSTAGVVPACRSLDAVSIFALTADDAKTVFDVAAVYDASDPFARPNPHHNSSYVQGVGRGQLTLGVPQPRQLNFFGDARTQQAFFHTLEQWRALGAEIVEIDFQPFLDAAKLLYEGPWVTERYIATKAVLQKYASAMHPVVRKITAEGEHISAEATFSAQYRLQALKRSADAELALVDFLLTPTTGTVFTINAVLGDPIALNNQLGYYTNYMNLLDYAAIALPYAGWQTPVPNGFTLAAPTFKEQKLLAWAKCWLDETATQLGNTRLPYTATPQTQFSDPETVSLVVCGAHLDGQPLNWQLTERGARKRATTATAPHYRLYALADGKRPGIERNVANGVAVEVEVWSMPAENFGSFVAAIGAPLGIGKVELKNGTWESGFICDAYGLEGAVDISHYGGWRAYLAGKS